jgi:hypothetical protein
MFSQAPTMPVAPQALPVLSESPSSSIDNAADELAIKSAAIESAWIEANECNRTIAELLNENDAYFAFKRTLIKKPNDFFTLFLTVIVLGFTLFWPLISWNASWSENDTHAFTNVHITDLILNVIIDLLIVSLVGTFFAAQHVSPDGRFGCLHTAAMGFKLSSWLPSCVSLLSVLSTLRFGLHLIWYASLDACASPPALTPSIPACSPSGMSLPSDRVAIMFLMPLLVLVFMPGMQFGASVLSWLIGCVCMCIAYALKGVFVDSYNALNAFFFLYALLKIDTVMWTAFVLYRSAVHNTARSAAAASRARQLEVALTDAEKKTLESNSAELRALMGNVAHDLKTPIQSISMGIELLRYACTWEIIDTNFKTHLLIAPTHTGRNILTWASPPSMAMIESTLTRLGISSIPEMENKTPKTMTHRIPRVSTCWT